MKKFFIATIALVGFSVASFAQTAPVTKNAKASKMQAVKKTKDTKTDAKVVAMNKTTKAVAPAAATAKTASAKAPAVAKTNVVLKKDGTPDKRYTAAKKTGPLKKDGTPDMRYKANKKSKS